MVEQQQQNNNTQSPKIRQEVEKIKDVLVEIRRHIHMYPETKYEEFETSKYILSHLEKIKNLEIKKNIAVTGIVAILRGKQEGPCILLRADMDALNLEEETGEIFTSKNKGKHHACGHDGHVAMLLGAVMIISEWQDKIKGTIKFLFQPAEEGGAGALSMIQDKHYPVLENPKVDKCFGIHLSNNNEFPYIGCLKTEGCSTANSDRFFIDIEGVGSHAMNPQCGIDAIYIGTSLVNSLYSIKSRNTDPMAPITISVGTINGGTLPNIISAKCKISGTVRTMGDQDRELVKNRFIEICKGYETMYNCKVILNYAYGYDSVFNTQEAINDVLKSSSKIYQTDDAGFGLAGEDFCFFASRAKSAFFLIGSAPQGSVKDKGRTIMCPHHSPFFTIDERCLTLGTSVWVQLVEDLMVV